MVLTACPADPGPPGDEPPTPELPTVGTTLPARTLIPAASGTVPPGQAISALDQRRLLLHKAVTFPVRAARSDDGILYLSDPGAGAVFGYRGATRVFALELARPLGLAVFGDRLLVGDDAAKSVSAYSRADGSLRFTFGAGAGEVSMPNGIAVSPDGERIYVADSKADAIKVYDASGQRLAVFDGGEDPLNFPSAVVADSGRVVVADQGNHRLRVFDPQGLSLQAIGSMPPENASSLHQLRGRLVRPQGLALVGESIAVLDSAFGTVQLFDAAGVSTGFLGGKGGCATCVDLALDLVWAPEDDAFVLLDPNRRRWVTVANTVRALP